jgi:signal transduction histidine kinase
LEIDAKRIKQIMFILIFNSLKHTTNGHIFITAKMKKTFREDYLKLKVIDSGCGIDLSIERNIFSLFSCVHTKKRANFAGMGAGLAIVKRIIEALNGTIKFSSILN